MTTIAIIVITAACFLAAVLHLATESRYKRRIMGVCTAAAVLLGIACYGYGFVHRYGASPTAVLRTLLAVCRMFAGVNDWGSIEEVPLLAHGFVQTAFWAAHFMAFYATASTAVAAVGGRMLRHIRIALLRRGKLLIIHGANAEALRYGQAWMRRHRRPAVFVCESCDASCEASVYAMGGVLEKHAGAMDAAFLRRMGINRGSRRIEAAALEEDGEKNLAFARALLAGLEAADVHSAQTALLLRGVKDEAACRLMAGGDAYGYGSVFAFDDYELCARMLIQQMPPCETIAFDDHARARQDFTVLLIGFGRMGRAVFRQMVMNGQFEGSTFRADIFDPHAQRGVLHGHELLQRYDVRFHAEDGNSDALYAFLKQQGERIRYVALCTGDDKDNREMAQDLRRWFDLHGMAPAVAQCSKAGVVFSWAGEEEIFSVPLFDVDALDIGRIDRMAMAINQTYCAPLGKTAAQNWAGCDYLSRMSSRASADFYPAVLRALGKTERQVMDGDWPPDAQALENLAMTEHLRWCAFHYAMGFSAMSGETFDARAQQYRSQVSRCGASSVRIGKDVKERRHACLIDWEELDALSQKENAITGGDVDYKQMDRDNVLALPAILAAIEHPCREHEGGKTA